MRQVDCLTAWISHHGASNESSSVRKCVRLHCWHIPRDVRSSSRSQFLSTRARSPSSLHERNACKCCRQPRARPRQSSKTRSRWLPPACTDYLRSCSRERSLRLRDRGLRHSNVGEVRESSRQYVEARCHELRYCFSRRKQWDAVLGSGIGKLKLGAVTFFRASTAPYVRSRVALLAQSERAARAASPQAAQPTHRRR